MNEVISKEVGEWWLANVLLLAAVRRSSQLCAREFTVCSKMRERAVSIIDSGSM